MTWEEAKNKIKDVMIKGSDINTPNSTKREIIAVDEHLNNKPYNYKNILGFRVKIGGNIESGKTIEIAIPWDMLKRCFDQLSTGKGYTSKFFETTYPKQYKNHGCHVHVVGQIFVRSNIAEARIIDNPRSPSYFLIEKD